MLIHSNFKNIGSFQSDWNEQFIKNEPMLFNCDKMTAYNLGGPITKHFLQNLPDSWNDCPIVVDSRVHMLMADFFFPAIPGYHHDDVPRSTTTGQPNYSNPEYRSEHLMGLVNGDICPTEFACGMIDLAIPKPPAIIYEVWHKEVINAINAKKLEVKNAESGKYIEFNDRAFHQATRAIKNGWRWFIRISKNTDRVNHCTNELRRQVQVYLESPMQGW